MMSMMQPVKQHHSEKLQRPSKPVKLAKPNWREDPQSCWQEITRRIGDDLLPPWPAQTPVQVLMNTFNSWCGICCKSSIQSRYVLSIGVRRYVIVKLKCATFFGCDWSFPTGVKDFGFVVLSKQQRIKGISQFLPQRVFKSPYVFIFLFMKMKCALCRSL